MPGHSTEGQAAGQNSDSLSQLLRADSHDSTSPVASCSRQVTPLASSRLARQHRDQHEHDQQGADEKRLLEIAGENAKGERVDGGHV